MKKKNKGHLENQNAEILSIQQHPPIRVSSKKVWRQKICKNNRTWRGGGEKQEEEEDGGGR